jgi:type II secretory pathway component PulF
MSNGNETNIRPSGESAPTLAAKPLSAEELITLNEEIAALAKAGLPLDQGLEVLSREMGKGRLKDVTEALATDLRAGFTLPQALDRRQGSVPSYYAALLNAGLRSGKLGDVLATMTRYSSSLADLQSTMVSALLYPAIILVVGIGLLIFVSKMVMPTFLEIFNSFKMKLPLMTEILFFIGENSMTVLGLPVLGIAVGLYVTRLALNRSPGGRVLWARFVYALPILGELVRSARLAAFTDLLGILIEQSVPLPEALRLASEASSDPLVLQGGAQVEGHLRDGASLSLALHRQRLVPQLVSWMIGFGERQNTLGSSLRQVAEMYRRKVELRSNLLRTLLPPLLVLILATTLGGVFIFGLMQPMVELLDGLSGTGKK